MFKPLTLLAGVAVCALTAPAAAQDTIPFNGPIKYVRHDMATGTNQIFDFDPAPASGGPGDSSPSVLWSNANTGGSFSVGGSNAVATHHHMGWGVATFLGAGAEITEFRMAYATGITVAQGTVAFRIRFYNGATGFGNQGSVNANGDLIITGLPNSASGGFEGYIVDVTLATPITMADGPFGYSYNSDASFTDGVNEITGPLLCIAPVGPGVTPNYDRYVESTNAYVNTFSFAAPNIGVFCMRLTGRATGAPASPWENYGVKSGVTLSATGSALPGSVDNVITIKNNPAGKSVILVAGVSQADFFSASIGLHFYAHPWLLQLNPLVTDPFSGNVVLPAPLPGTLTAGDEIYMQAFGQNLSNQYKKWSEGLKLTVQ
jgi:hypothetical protein